jgi:hypothetical protein
MSIISKFWPFSEDIAKWSIFRYFSKFSSFLEVLAVSGLGGFEATRPTASERAPAAGAQN